MAVAATDTVVKLRSLIYDGKRSSVTRMVSFCHNTGCWSNVGAARNVGTYNAYVQQCQNIIALAGLCFWTELCPDSLGDGLMKACLLFVDVFVGTLISLVVASNHLMINP